MFVLKVVDQIFKHLISEEKEGKPAFHFTLDFCLLKTRTVAGRGGTRL